MDDIAKLLGIDGDMIKDAQESGKKMIEILEEIKRKVDEMHGIMTASAVFVPNKSPDSTGVKP